MSIEHLMTIREVSALLRVSQQTLYKMVDQGTIPALRIGNQWRFDRSRVLSWIQKGGAAANDNDLSEERLS
jgi:excisionase family DNA binding protein